MHHLVLDRWSQGTSPLHARDPRTKLVVFLVLLIAIATTRPGAQLAFAGYLAVLLAALAAANLPLFGVLARAALVLPFTFVFAAATWWTGAAPLAIALLERSYLSGLAAVLFIGTTPLSAFAAALSWWRVPRALVLTIQFLYRYWFVLAEQAQRMRWAARSRGGSSFAVGVLFARSWERAAGIERAMRARGFTGQFPATRLGSVPYTEIAVAALGIAIPLTIRWAI